MVTSFSRLQAPAIPLPFPDDHHAADGAVDLRVVLPYGHSVWSNSFRDNCPLAALRLPTIIFMPHYSKDLSALSACQIV